MKLLIFIFTFFPIIIFAQDFKSFKWGDLPSVIKSNEKSKLIRATKDSLFYESKVANMDTKLIYFFREGKLDAVIYEFDHVQEDKEHDIDSLNIIRKLLVEKYGKPSNIKKFSILHTYITEWEMPRTHIYCWIEKYNGKTRHQITYRTNIKETEEKKKNLNIL